MGCIKCPSPQSISFHINPSSLATIQGLGPTPATFPPYINEKSPSASSLPQPPSNEVFSIFESHRVRTPHLTFFLVTFATFLYSPSPIPQPPQTCYACDWTASNIITQHQELWFSEDRCPCDTRDQARPQNPSPPSSRGCRCLLGPKTPLQLLCLLCEPLPPLPSPPPPEPRQSQSGPRPFRTLPRPRPPPGVSSIRGPVSTSPLTPRHPRL